jgi:hypothetical protein
MLSFDGNGNLITTLPTNPAQAGYARLVGRFDGGTSYRDVVVSQYGGLKTSPDSLQFFENFPSTNINYKVWNVQLTTFTVAQAADFLTLNSGNVTTANAVARIQTWRTFNIMKVFSTRITIDALISSYQNNVTVELGVGIATGVAPPTDGAFFRYNNAGSLVGVLNYNGAEVSTSALTLPTATVPHKHTINISDYGVDFYIDDVFQAHLDCQAGTASPLFYVNHQILIRQYNGATAPALAVNLKIGQVQVIQRDLNNNRPWSTQAAGCGWGSYQQPSGLTAAGQTANWANSAAPASATLSNTAAGYGPTLLGGQWQFAAVAGAETDYVLFAYLVPAQGKNMVIRGVHIETFNMGAAVATTPTVLQWALAVGTTAITLATADGAGTVAATRIPIGSQYLPLSAPIGAQANTVDINLGAPVYAPAGTYVQLILKIPVGSATASEIIRGVAVINGYFE